MKPSEYLQKARDLIAEPGAWTQGEWARNADGDRVYLRAESAVRFCADGALRAISERGRFAANGFLRRVLPGAPFYPNTIEFNDAKGRTQAEVVDAFNRAIELAKSEGK